jgi:hypothetical protein
MIENDKAMNIIRHPRQASSGLTSDTERCSLNQLNQTELAPFLSIMAGHPILIYTTLGKGVFFGAGECQLHPCGCGHPLRQRGKS